MKIYGHGTHNDIIRNVALVVIAICIILKFIFRKNKCEISQKKAVINIIIFIVLILIILLLTVMHYTVGF